MVLRKVPDPEHARNEEFSDKTVERFQSYSRQALNHAMGRNARVVKVLCYTSLLCNSGCMPTPVSIRVTAAEFQNYSSQHGNQAAHYLPGQLKLNNRKVSEWASKPKNKLLVSALFGDVEDLPADFNKADTQAEASGKSGGLCAAFEAAVHHVIDHSIMSSTINRVAVSYAYRTIWVPRANRAYNMALTKKSNTYTRPEPKHGTGVDHGVILNLPEIEEVVAKDGRFHHQQDILRHYLASLGKEPRELQQLNMTQLERQWVC